MSVTERDKLSELSGIKIPSGRIPYRYINGSCYSREIEVGLIRLSHSRDEPLHYLRDQVIEFAKDRPGPLLTWLNTLISMAENGEKMPWEKGVEKRREGW